MTCSLHVAWDARLAKYDFGVGHPMAPARVELAIELARAFGLFAVPGVTVERPSPATDVDLQTVHIPHYIAAVRQAGGSVDSPAAGKPGSPGPGDPAGFGLGTDDNPVFAGMHDASALVAGATLAAARAVWTGAAKHGASIAGGLHHAMYNSASGFCVYNDLAVAIHWLLSQGASRIAYVDIDVHHGDGVQAAFYDDPRVLTISLHETPRRCGPAPGGRRKRAGPARRGARSTWPCRLGPRTPAGCGPSTPWCRTCCVPSARTSWSASTAATRTGSIPWPTWS